MVGSERGNTEPTEVFGPYLVYERLGVGGMATVHRAKKRGIEGFERVCALKRLLPHLAEDTSFVKSFVREAKLAAMLQHANTAQIFELGRVGSVYFMAMELVEGYDLRKVLRQARRLGTPPPIAVVLSILGELCDALDYAHNRADDSTGEPLGIVHRDVSPSNLIVTRPGHLKVIDFGIAKATSQTLKTDTGRVKGKLGYMSPEAIRGKPLDARSDIFSAGIVAHELLSVRPLFASRNDYDTLTKIQRGEVVPPSSYNTNVPIELDDLVLKALAKAPHERFHSAAEMREALQRVALVHALPASSRVASDWLGWAFADGEDAAGPPATAWRPPSDPAGSDIPSGDSQLPVAEADDEVIEIAWGGRDDMAEGPIIMPDVPDVSEQIPGPAALFAQAELGADGPDTDVVMESIAPRRGRVRRRSLVDIPVADVLAPKITYHTPAGESSAVAEIRAVAPTPQPVPVIPSDGTKIATVPPPPKPEPPPAWARGTVPPKFEPGRGPRRRQMSSGGETVFPKPRVDASEPSASSRGALSSAEAIASHTGARVRVAAALGAGFGLVVAATAFVVAKGEQPNATAGATTPPAAAAPTLAELAVRSTPEGLTLLVDGEAAATTTPTTIEVAPGPHRISLARDGTELWHTQLEARAGTHYELHPVLETPAPLVLWTELERRSGRGIRIGHALTATARVCVTERGNVSSVDVPNADSKDVAVIRKTVRKWRFKPYRSGGKRIAVCFDMPIDAR